MDRRMFIGAFAVGLVAAPLPTLGQPPPMKTYRIGFLGSESASYERDRVEVVRNGLRELGHPEGASSSRPGLRTETMVAWMASPRSSSI